ncbi:penicillin-binding protein activator [candidate division WOR-3 bacterium]|nr:penicillin-binding protein activator [candidate division WOR-3 bacterium]
MAILILFLLLNPGLQIGFLAPLSGEYKVFGEEVRDGINLVQSPLSIISLDTQGDPIIAINKTQELVSNNQVIAIIGPLLSVSTLPSACIANCHKVPLIAPTATESRIPDIGEWIFRLNSDAESQALVIADYAYRNLGLKNCCILAPCDAYTQNVVHIFSQEFKRLGGEVLISKIYESGQLDFKDEIIKIKELSPQAIFIPAYPEDILIIIHQLWYYQIIPNSIKILGTNGWGDEKVIKEGKKYVENVIFTEFKKNLQFRKEFYSKYTRLPRSDKRSGTEPSGGQKREPTRFSRLGWSAMMLVSKAIEDGVKTREELKNWLKDNEDKEVVPGVALSPIVGMKLVKLYKIKGNKKKELLYEKTEER